MKSSVFLEGGIGWSWEEARERKREAEDCNIIYLGEEVKVGGGDPSGTGSLGRGENLDRVEGKGA